MQPYTPLERKLLDDLGLKEALLQHGKWCWLGGTPIMDPVDDTHMGEIHVDALAVGPRPHDKTLRVEVRRGTDVRPVARFLYRQGLPLNVIWQRYEDLFRDIMIGEVTVLDGRRP